MIACMIDLKRDIRATSLSVSLMLIALVAASSPGCKKFGLDSVTRKTSTSPMVSFASVTDRKAVGAEISGLEIALRAGTIKIVGDEGSDLQIKAEVKVRKSRLDGGITPSPGSFSDHVRVDMVDGKIQISSVHMDADDADDWQIYLVVRVPARLATTAKIAAGVLAVEGMQSSLNLNNAAGKISIKSDIVGAVTAISGASSIDVLVGAVTGPVSAEVGAGNVSLIVTNASPTHDVRLVSGTGNIILDIPDNSPGTYSVKSAVGVVRVSGQGDLKVKRSAVGSMVEGVVGEGGPVYKLRNSVGKITIR